MSYHCQLHFLLTRYSWFLGHPADHLNKQLHLEVYKGSLSLPGCCSLRFGTYKWWIAPRPRCCWLWKCFGPLSTDSTPYILFLHFFGIWCTYRRIVKQHLMTGLYWHLVFRCCYCSFAKDFWVNADVSFLGFCVPCGGFLVFVNTLVFHEGDGFVTCVVFICR